MGSICCHSLTLERFEHRPPIGTRRLDQLNISNFKEYTQLLPSVAFQTSQPGMTTVYMRGVASGDDGNHSGSLPSVGSYLDEQPLCLDSLAFARPVPRILRRRRSCRWRYGGI